jgi:hypothetical protein
MQHLNKADDENTARRPNDQRQQAWEDFHKLFLSSSPPPVLNSILVKAQCLDIPREPSAESIASGP